MKSLQPQHNQLKAKLKLIQIVIDYLYPKQMDAVTNANYL